MKFLWLGLLLGIVVQPNFQPKEVKVPELKRKESNAQVMITDDSKMYLDGKSIRWPLPHNNVQIKKLVVDQEDGYNKVIEVWFETLPPSGWWKW